MKIYIRALALFILPSFILRLFQRSLGLRLHKNAKIGFSFIFSERIVLLNGAKIGHFNLIKLQRMYLGRHAYIQNLNRITGAISVKLSSNAGVGNLNTILRAPLTVKNVSSSLYLGKLSKITSRHYIDCLCNITIGSYSTIAGVGSQLWSHGYYHFPDKNERVRIDGAITIGKYCYVGSSSVFNPGVKICDSVNLGSNSSIAKSISVSGFYVSQPLRLIKQDGDFDSRLKLGRVDESCEKFYVKTIE
ncbi:hypothetical protein PSH55_16900 [Pseudoalteromonas sp. Angola-31]|nr:hypothetical protein [Pseudoalteromonas sp. Angola-31]